MASSSETGSTLLHKIVIPVITTVMGATAIYFLGFNRKSSSPGSENVLVIKEATIKAWKSFVTSQNIAYKNEMSITDEYTKKIAAEAKKGLDAFAPLFRDFEDELFRESRKANHDIEEILKNENIDDGFVSMLNRALDNGKDQEKKVASFFDNINSLAKSNMGDEEKERKWQEEVAKFQEMGKKVEERAATEAEGIAKTLSERYNQPFDLNELLVYVDYKKEKEEKKTDNPAITNTSTSITAPTDPNAGNEYKENLQPGDNDAGKRNEIEPTASLLTGQWTMSKGTLELSRNGDMFWTFDGKGYTSGDWKLLDGDLRMNATNPDTRKTSLLIGILSNVTRNSFTMTFMTTPKEVYNFTRKN